MSPVWQYFGLMKDAEGAVIFDGFPVCRICRRKVEAQGGDTANMFLHLKTNHLDVYKTIKPPLWKRAYTPFDLAPPDGQTNVKLWEHFGYPKNPDGAVEDDGEPVCKICLQKLKRSTIGATVMTIMLRHLRKKHPSIYDDVQESISSSRSDMDNESLDLYPPTETVTSPAWKYFGYPKDATGAVACDGYPTCRLCRDKVSSRGGTTTNMLKHLKEHHPAVHDEMSSAVTKEASVVVSDPSELHPPSGEHDATLWEHFGYPKTAEGELNEDGAPFCKLCLRRLLSYGETTRNMKQHLRNKHPDVYNVAEEAITPLSSEEGANLSELHPPTRNVKSAVWKYFGYPRDSEGSVVRNGYPICKLCQKKVASKGGTTTNMFKHLKEYHQSVHDFIRSAVTDERLEDDITSADLYPPCGGHDQTLWEHFGYRRTAEGVLEEDGAPFCKHCLRKLVSTGETSRNMRQHLKEDHSDIYTDPGEMVTSFSLAEGADTSDLHPPTRKVKSVAWKYFGYPLDAKGSVMCDGYPICKLCQKKVSAKGGNTTNMFTHLRDYHRTTYDEIKLIGIPEAAEAAEATETVLEPLDLHVPPDALSPVWEHFGYQKNASGFLVCDGFPICRLCHQKVVAREGSITNMLIHLRAYHLAVYRVVKPAVVKKAVYRALELFPPSGQDDIKLWNHFGYPKNPEGVLQDDGAPICKICLRKLMRTSDGGPPTTNMLRHLRKKHQTVYDEVQEAITALRTEWGIEPPELHPPTQNVTSAVWQYFGYLKDAEGTVMCDDFPICRLCQQKVASKTKCTTNMFKHLKDYHRPVYDEIRCAVTNETLEDVGSQIELFPPSGQHNPKLWEHFGYRRAEDGQLEEDGAPFCKLCSRKLVSKGETIPNMMQHLKENHNNVYAEVQKEVNPFTIGGATHMPELHPPKHRVRSALWNHFGYVRETEAPADCAGFPICKICLCKVSNKGKVTANMSAHLREHHTSVYCELKIPEKKSKVVSPDSLPELFPPSKSPQSPLWQHFGLPKNAEGHVEEDGCPICKVCGRKVSRQEKRKMLRHLQFCHPAVYQEYKKTVKRLKLGSDVGGEGTELFPPSKGVRSSVWEYFGYLKRPDGTINADGRPICKKCYRKVSSQGGNTTNMFKHLEDKHGISQ